MPGLFNGDRYTRTQCFSYSTLNTQRIRSRFARAVCGGVGRARPVCPDAGPKRPVVDRSTSRSQNNVNLHDFPRHVMLPIFSAIRLSFMTTSGLENLHLRHRVKFCPNRANSFVYLAIKRFSKWRPSAILGLLGAYLEHQR